MKHIFLILLGFSLTVEAKFIRNDYLGVVNDTVTQLQWQDVYRDDDGDLINGVWLPWEEALDYCQNLILGGGGWRLPNIRELNSIVDYKQFDPTINPIFKITRSMYHWSSTTSRYEELLHGYGHAYATSFFASSTISSLKWHYHAVRCVR